MSQEPKNKIWVKIILAGDSKVGKTTLANAFKGRAEKNPEMTIGVDVHSLRLEDTVVYFTIFDLGGNPRFDELRDLYYAGALAIGLVFDLSNPDSLNNLLLWAKEIKKAKETAKGRLFEDVVLIGNKSDLVQMMSDKKIESVIKLLEEGFGIRVVKFIKTSALRGDGVEECFEELVKVAIRNLAYKVINKLF